MYRLRNVQYILWLKTAQQRSCPVRGKGQENDGLALHSRFPSRVVFLTLLHREGYAADEWAVDDDKGALIDRVFGRLTVHLIALLARRSVSGFHHRPSDARPTWRPSTRAITVRHCSVCYRAAAASLLTSSIDAGPLLPIYQQIDADACMLTAPTTTTLRCRTLA